MTVRPKVRDKDGIYTGDHHCVHWQGVGKISDAECCGGRKIRIATAKCDLMGEVSADAKCNGSCSEREYSEGRRL